MAVKYVSVLRLILNRGRSYLNSLVITCSYREWNMGKHSQKAENENWTFQVLSVTFRFEMHTVGVAKEQFVITVTIFGSNFKDNDGSVIFDMVYIIHQVSYGLN